MPERILDREPRLAPLKETILTVYNHLSEVFTSGNRLFVCGNGGSFADSIHIVGELVKSFEKKRPLNKDEQEALKGLYGADALAPHLEKGLPAYALGTNLALNTALLNDVIEKEILFAQELYVLGSKGDALIGISTSGNARNVMLAVSAARAMGISTIALTGRDGGLLKDAVDIAIVADEHTTREVQQVHQLIYHTLCLMLEEHFYG
ncbi:SIS domain-containing protein [Planctomycetota bacterium]